MQRDNFTKYSQVNQICDNEISAWERWFWLETLKVRDHLGNLGIEDKILRPTLKKHYVRMGTGLIWLRIEISGGLSDES